MGSDKFPGAVSSGLLTTDAAVLTTDGYLIAVILLGDGAADSTVAVYDHASSATGTVVCKLAVSPETQTAVFTPAVPVTLSNGIWVDLDTANNANAVILYCE